MGDFGIGIRYAAQFCECQYALAVSLGWEQHVFLDQNQLWRAERDTNDFSTDLNAQSHFHQRRGDLDTQGWTLKFVFDF